MRRAQFLIGMEDKMHQVNFSNIVLNTLVDPKQNLSSHSYGHISNALTKPPIHFLLN
jgi:hypothetical protein